MTTDPVVSIVVATSRWTPYFTEALRSVCDQTFGQWELIVVDDGCAEPERLRKEVDAVPGAAVIRQDNRGAAAARNRGCTRAVGQYVTFLDDDDYWPPERLAAQVEVLRQHPASVASCGRLAYVDGDGTVFGAGPDCSSDVALRSAGFHLGTVMVRRDAMPASGWFDPLLPRAQDLDFCLRLAHAGRIEYMSRTLVYYRRHDHNVTNRRAHARGFGREVYEHHYRLARLRSDVRSARAIAQTVQGTEAYLLEMRCVRPDTSCFEAKCPARWTN